MEARSEVTTNKHKELETLFQQHGYKDYKWIEPRKIVVSHWVEWNACSARKVPLRMRPEEIPMASGFEYPVGDMDGRKWNGVNDKG